MDQSTNMVEGEIMSPATPEVEGYTPKHPEINFTARSTTGTYPSMDIVDTMQFRSDLDLSDTEESLFDFQLPVSQEVSQ